MDQGSTFNNNSNQFTPSVVPPVAPSSNNTVAQQSGPNPPPNFPPQNPLPDQEGGLSRLSLGSLIKVFLGIIVILFILFLIFSVILPKLTKSSNKTVTLNYWGLWEEPSVMNQIIGDFERQNPNIKISYSTQDIKDYRERLTTRIANGTGPDIMRFHNSWYPMLSSILLPLPESVIAKDEFTKNYFQVAQKDLIRNGAIYGIPLEIDTLSLYINNDILNSAGLKSPTTWEEFRDVAKNTTVKDENGKIKTAGAAIGTYDNVSHAPDLLSLLFVQNGADLKTFTNSSQQVTDALRFYTSFASGDSSVWDTTLDPSVVAFSKGNVGMIFGYSWDYFNIKSANPTLNFSVVPVPQLDKNNPSDIASYWAEGISTKSKHQKEAMMFLRFLSQKTTQEKIYTEESKTRFFGEPYSRIDLASTLKTDQRVASFISQAPFATSSYFVDSTYDNGLNTKLNTYLGNGINSISQNTSPESATATLFQGYDQVLKEYGQ